MRKEKINAKRDTLDKLAKVKRNLRDLRIIRSERMTGEIGGCFISTLEEKGERLVQWYKGAAF